MQGPCNKEPSTALSFKIRLKDLIGIVDIVDNAHYPTNRQCDVCDLHDRGMPSQKKHSLRLALLDRVLRAEVHKYRKYRGVRPYMTDPQEKSRVAWKGLGEGREPCGLQISGAGDSRIAISGSKKFLCSLKNRCRGTVQLRVAQRWGPRPENSREPRCGLPLFIERSIAKKRSRL